MKIPTVAEWNVILRIGVFNGGALLSREQNGAESDIHKRLGFARAMREPWRERG